MGRPAFTEAELRNRNIDPFILELRRLRLTRGVFQHEVARHLKIAECTFNRLETGKGHPLTLRHLRRWAKALGMKIELRSENGHEPTAI